MSSRGERWQKMRKRDERVTQRRLVVQIRKGGATDCTYEYNVISWCWEAFSKLMHRTLHIWVSTSAEQRPHNANYLTKFKLISSTFRYEGMTSSSMFLFSSIVLRMRAAYSISQPVGVRVTVENLPIILSFGIGCIFRGPRDKGSKRGRFYLRDHKAFLQFKYTPGVRSPSL